MHGQKQSPDNNCCCCSLRAGCITIGIAELLLIPSQTVFFINMVQIPVIRLFYIGILVGVCVAAPLIYGAIKQSRFFLWPSILFNIVCVFAVPLIYCGIEIRNTRDPLGNASIWIYTSLLIQITMLQAFFALMLCRYSCQLREEANCKHKYDKVGAAGADKLYPIPV